MRTFVGIDFTNEVKEEIIEVQNRLKGATQSGRWKSIDDLHLTLKFLGEVNSAQLIQVHDAVKNICMEKAPFELSVSGIWTFDDKDAVKFLWLGLAGDLDQLRNLQGDIDSALAPVGFPAEKRGFAPHVTIGENIVFKTDFAKVADDLGSVQLSTMPIKSIYLFESKREHNKRGYHKIAEYPLTVK